MGPGPYIIIIGRLVWNPCLILKLSHRSIQHEVERRVVAQLALAHELGQLRQGCDVTFVLDCQSQATNSLVFKSSSLT